MENVGRANFKTLFNLIYKYFKLFLLLQIIYFSNPQTEPWPSPSVREEPEDLEGEGVQDGEERGGHQQEDTKVQSDSAKHAPSEVPCELGERGGESF